MATRPGGDQLAAVTITTTAPRHARGRRPADSARWRCRCRVPIPSWRLVGGHQPVSRQPEASRQPGDRPSVVLRRSAEATVGIRTPAPACSGRSTLAVTMSGAPLGQRVHTTTRSCDAATAPDSNRSPGCQAARPESSHVTPPGQQVGWAWSDRAGDGVVVHRRPVTHALANAACLRILGAGQQRGEHREPLGFQDGVLGGPVGLFGVDVETSLPV